MTDTEINVRIREALTRADAPGDVCENPLNMRGRAFRFSRRSRDEGDEQRPIVGSIMGFEFAPNGTLMIHVDVRTFRSIPFSSIDLNASTGEWTMNFGVNSASRVPGRFTVL